MIRVCHIVQSYYPRDPRIRRQAEALAEAGHQVDVVCLRNQEERSREVINGVNVIRMPLTRKRGGVGRYMVEYGAFFAMAFLYAAFTLHKRYQVYHVSNLPDFLVFSAAVPRLLGRKVLLDEHDLLPELFMSKYGLKETDLATKVLRFQERLSLRFASEILTVTQPFKDHYGAIVNNKRISIVMNLPDDKLFLAPDGSRRFDKEGPFTLIYAGTVTAIYDLTLVVQAVARLRDRIGQIRLRIVGDGDSLDSLKALAAEMGVEDIVEFMGDKPFSAIPQLMAESDVGISTLKLDPLTDKCFNNKTGEYVAMGLPSISTRTTAVADYYPADAVRLVEPGSVESIEEAILELYASPELRRQMSARGLEFSKRSNWSTEKVKYVSLIERIAG